MTSEPKDVRVGDQSFHDWHYDDQAHTVTVTVGDAVKDWNVRLAF